MDRALRYGRRGCEFKSYFVYSYTKICPHVVQVSKSVFQTEGDGALPSGGTCFMILEVFALDGKPLSW